MAEEEQPKKEISFKGKILFSVIGALIAIGLSFALAFIVLAFEKDMYGPQVTFKLYWANVLLDGFSIITIFLFCMFLFAYLQYSCGFFDIFAYAFKRFGTSLWFSRPKGDNNTPRTFYDYKQEKAGKPKPYYRWILWDSLVLLGITIIFVILYTQFGLTYY